MKKIGVILFAAMLLMSCGDKSEVVEEEVVKLDDFKDRLSYVLGSMNAK